MVTPIMVFSIILLIYVGCAIFSVYRISSGRPPAPNIPCPPKPKQVKEVEFTRLTMKAIIRWEQIRGRAFSVLDYADREDIEALLYTMYCGEVKSEYTFEVFRQVLADERFMNSMFSDLSKIMRIVAQFQKQTDSPGISNAEGNPNPVKASEIIATLIMSGLDAGYVLNDMELCDLPMYIEAYERQKKERMEESRMWTYFTMLPHIDAKKMKNGARDLIIFPWEEQEIQREAERALREDADRFEEFMKQGRNFKS